jgi:uncharacterized membrane protein YdbT with pleckstrin-like domain
MTPHKRDEVDAWWGSYSVKNILPALFASLAASALVVGASWLFPYSRVGQFIVLGVLAAFWLTLLLLWIYLIFGINYRLTSRRLFVERGLSRRRLQSVDLATISQVNVKANRLERFLGVGRVFVEVQGSRATSVILGGVPAPEMIAEKIRAQSEKAKQ